MDVTAQPIPSNFAFIKEHDEQLVHLDIAERNLPDDPNICLLKLRQLTELLAELVATRTGLYVSREEAQFDPIRRLQDRCLLPREVAQRFGEVRRAGNATVHEGTHDQHTALAMLRVSWQLGAWYHRTFKDRSFRSGPFIPPVAPPDESSALRAELDRLTKTLDEYRGPHTQAAQELQATQERLKSTQVDRELWEAVASEADQARGAFEKRLAELQAAATANPPNVSEGDDDAVLKITGSADQPLELIRRYKNERLSNVALTVDLLATGIDVRAD